MKAPFSYSLTPGEGFKTSGPWGEVEVEVFGDAAVDFLVRDNRCGTTLYFSEEGAKSLISALQTALDFAATQA